MTPRLQVELEPERPESERAAAPRWSGRLWAAGLVVVAALAAGAGMLWRFTAPVQVSFVSEIGDLPFTVEAIPPVVRVQPGTLVSITYRIRNNDVSPITAFGRLELAPAAAPTQMVIYVTQCGGLITYPSGSADDYNLVFRVEPAGWWGTSQIVVKHIFTRTATQ